MKNGPLLVFAGLLLATTAQAAPRVFQNLNATRVVFWQQAFAPGTYTFETANPTPGTDTVIQVVGPFYLPGSTRALGMDNLGHNDDAPGLGLMSRVTVTFTQFNVYTIVVHAFSNESAGRADLLQNGIALLRNAEIGGTHFVVDPGDFRFQTALEPHGTNDTLLFASYLDGHIFSFDDDSGVGRQSELIAPSAIRMIVAAYSTPGKTSVYVNDYHDDADGDGLGHELESALGICDRRGTPLCNSVYNLKDSDRDGIPDTYEVLGKDDPFSPQYLPAWGADPRHKDVFAEIDTVAGQPSLILTAEDANRVQEFWFNEPSAADVGNIDGLDGIRIHLDIQVDADRSQRYPRYGRWGGSNMANTDNYSIAPNSAANFHPVRKGIFRYALFDGLHYHGQTGKRDRAGWGSVASDHGMHTFVHELLGHGLGLEHHGHDSWGQLNCKPNYISIMSYAYGGPSTKFSKGQNAGMYPLDPSNASEGSPFAPSGFGTSLRDKPFALNVDATSGIARVDWDRDGLFVNAGSVRAPVTWAPGEGCAPFLANAQMLRHDLPIDATGPIAAPDLVRLGNRLYAFHVNAGGRLRYHHAPIGGPDADGSCPNGSTFGTNCTNWTGPVEVPVLHNVAGFSALRWGNGVMVAAREPGTNELWLIQARDANASGELGFRYEVPLGPTSIDPELADLVTAAGEVLALFYADSTHHRWMSVPDYGAPVEPKGRLRALDGAELRAGVIGASATTFPNRTQGAALPAFARTCALFPTRTNPLALYCYDKSQERWQDLSGTLPCLNPLEGGDPYAPTCAPVPFTTRPALQYHVDRKGGGAPISNDGVRGRFLVAFGFRVKQGDGSFLEYPKLLHSSPLSATSGPGPTMRWPVYGNIGDDWTVLPPGSGISLFEDNATSAPKGIWLQDLRTPNNGPMKRGVRFLPLMDGAPSVQLKDGNDFRVMERNICLGLQDESWCGDKNSSPWRY